MKRSETSSCLRGYPSALRDQQGQTIAEYAVLIAAAVLLVLAFLFLGWKVGGAIQGAGDSAASPAPLKRR